MKLIQTISLNSSTSAISFTGIPQTETDLFIIGSIRGAFNNVFDRCQVSVNSSSGTWSNTRTQSLFSSNSPSQSSGNSFFTTLDYFPAATGLSNSFGFINLYFPNYSLSGVTKTVNFETGAIQNVRDYNSTGFGSARYSTADSITQLSIAFGQGNIETGSTVSLYTITKGSGGATVS